jgi:hypothetical protein
LRLISSFLALALSTSAALAGDVAPLTPGAPAGVKRAQDVGLGSNTILYIALGAAAVAGIAVAASGGDDAKPAAPTVTTTLNTTS